MSTLSLFRTPPPDVTVEIAPRHVVALVLETDRGGGRRVAAHAVVPLAPGAVTPALNVSNVARPDEVTAAIERAWTVLGQRPGRVGLVVPDSVAKVSFVRFATVPARQKDLDEMVRFQVRKAAPFGLADAQITFTPGVATADGQEFIVVQARRDIVAEYEQVCAAAGAHAGAVGLATFNVVNASLAGGGHPAGDWILIHVTPDAATLAILRGEHMVFFRHRGADGDGHLGELIHQTAMYYQDRLGGSGFTRALVAGALPEEAPGRGQRELEARLGAPVLPIDPTVGVPLADRIGPTRDLIDALTPALGMALALGT